MDKSSVIPKEFLEVDDYDRSNRLLRKIYIRQPDDAYGNEQYKRGRMANVKRGNVFAIVDPLIKEPIDFSKITKYRAIEDAYFSKKQNQVVIKVTTLEDYLEEQSVKSGVFEVPDYDPCRKKE